MKNKKIFIYAFAICGLAFVASCNKDDDETTVAVPTNLTASGITPTGAVLSWTSAEQSFEVKIGNNTYSTTAASYTASGLTPATAYPWEVRAKKDDAYSEWASSSFTTAAAPLPAPTNLQVGNVTYYSAEFSWTGSASSYEFKLTGGNANDPENYVDVTETLSATSYTYSLLNYSTSYTWQVRAKNAETYSEWANGDGFITADRPTQRGAQISFGTYTWSANAFGAIVDFEDPYTQVQLYSSDPSGWETTDDFEYPFFQFFVAGNTADTYSSTNGYTPSYDYDVDYFHQSFIDIYGDGSFITGDYWMDADFPSSIEITEISESAISGTVDLTLIDILTFIESEYETIINVPLTITFLNIPVTDYASLSAPAAASKSSVQSKPVLKPGKYPLKPGKQSLKSSKYALKRSK